MAPVRGMAEMVINVRDIEGMRKFYQEVLGFPFQRQYPEDSPTIVFLTVAETDTPLGRGRHPQLFALVDAERHAPTRDNYRGIDHARSSLNHLAFEIDEADYDSQRQRLEGLGLAVTPQAFPAMQAKALFFSDPEGNTLELICHDSEVGSM